MVISCYHYLNRPKYIKQVVELFCRNCGKELLGTPEICLNCGAKPLAGSSFCQACGAATDSLAEICMKCGARLAKAVSPVGIGWMPTEVAF